MVDLAPYLPGFIAAYAILLVGASSPGPSVAMLIGVATSQGRAPALMATLGIAVGSMTINLLTMLGVGLILSQAAWAMSLMRLIGALYLLYLAYGAFRRALNPPAFQEVITERRSGLRHFLRGYLLQVSNPKAIAFWLAIASIGAVEGAGVGIIALFVVGAAAISFLCHGAWALALSAAPVRRAYAAGRRWIEAGLGVFFTFAAFKLATEKI
ncbi:LysE family translocator [uncultured Roseovarius sp.]|uniref:LysE family translocator n=1 Tax=uncultured Roseovarius sp. TaxID=293344 RepID=UPI002608AEC8|nr:LysE family translocator [uncultured Roseovarius sp.]